jgi:hypothetical protein
MGIIWEEPDETPESAIEKLKRIIKCLFETKAVNPWCGICQSRDLHYEDGLTPFKSREEALPFVNEVQARNLLTREFISADTAFKRN